MKRYLEDVISEDLQEKMVFLGGPRQVGKTTLALNLLEGGSENHPAYLSWDVVAPRKALLQGPLPGGQSLVILDEIHKYKGWRNLVKGFYDSSKSHTRFLITGSARLDHYRRGGDSMQGRYHYHRLHPLSLYEISNNPTRSDVDHLLQFGGFPEPFLKGNTRHWKRWQRERQSRVIQDDLISLEHVKEVSQLDLLAHSLPDRVGSPLSVNNLRQDLSVAFETADRWINILENLYVCFRIRPHGLPQLRAVKKERKLYMWDWSLCENPAARFENLVASHLLKHCHARGAALCAGLARPGTGLRRHRERQAGVRGGMQDRGAEVEPERVLFRRANRHPPFLPGPHGYKRLRGCTVQRPGAAVGNPCPAVEAVRQRRR